MDGCIVKLLRLDSYTESKAKIVFQTALFSSMGLELLSGIFFMWTTLYVISDRRKAEEEERKLQGTVYIQILAKKI